MCCCPESPRIHGLRDAVRQFKVHLSTLSRYVRKKDKRYLPERRLLLQKIVQVIHYVNIIHKYAKNLFSVCFSRRSGVLEADGLFSRTSHITTKFWATVTSEKILDALRFQEEKKIKNNTSKAATF